MPQSNRWTECDEIDDPILRIDCRTSASNDAIHELNNRVWRLEQGSHKLQLFILVASPIIITALNILKDKLGL